MAADFQTIAFKVNTTHFISVYKASDPNTPATVLLAQTSQVAKPMVRVRGATHGRKHKKAGPAMRQSTVAS